MCVSILRVRVCGNNLDLKSSLCVCVWISTAFFLLLLTARHEEERRERFTHVGVRALRDDPLPYLLILSNDRKVVK